MGLPQKFKVILNIETNEIEETAWNILKYLIRLSSLQLPIGIIYDFETMNVETDDQSKLWELRKNRNKSFAVKTSGHTPIEFAGIDCKRL